MKKQSLFIITLWLLLSPHLKAEFSDTIKLNTKGQVVFSLTPPFENANAMYYYPEPDITGIGWASRSCNTEAQNGVIEQTTFAIAAWAGVAGIATRDGIRGGGFSVNKTGSYALRIKGTSSGSLIEGSSASITGVSKSGGIIWLAGGFTSIDAVDFILYETDFSGWAFLEEAAWTAIKVACELYEQSGAVAELIGVVKNLVTPKKSWNNEPFEIYSYDTLIAEEYYNWDLALVSSIAAGAFGWNVHEVALYDAQISNLKVDLIYLDNDTNDNTPPTLSNPQVYPSAGTESTEFEFLVDYYDPDGEPPLPTNRQVYISDGNSSTPHTMVLKNGDEANGTYHYKTTLPLGLYSYFFSFINTIGQSAMTDWYNGPQVFDDENIVINPVINCSRISSDLTFAYSLTGLGEWTYFTISDEPNLNPISIPPGSTIWFTASVASENYEYLNKWELVKDGNIELESTSSIWSIIFNPSASGAYTLNAYYEYTPQEYTISGTINGTTIPDNVELTLSSPEQAITQTSTDGNFSFTGVLGGVSVTITPSAVGYSFSPSLLVYHNLKDDHINENIVAYASDVEVPITSLINTPQEISIEASVSFSWAGEDNVTNVGNILYQYKLDSIDADWSDWTSLTSKSYELPNGIYTFWIRAKDEAENINQAPDNYNFIVNAAPKYILSERLDNSVWASRITLYTPAEAVNPSNIFVLLPEHFGINDQELVPILIYETGESLPFGVNEVISERTGLPTKIKKGISGYIITLPDTILPGQTVSFDIQWGKIKYFGWQEFVSVPEGFPNGGSIKTNFLDDDSKLWRSATKQVNHGTGNACDTDGWLFYNIYSKEQTIKPETVIDYIHGNCTSGSIGTWSRFDPKKFIKSNTNTCLLYIDEQWEYDGSDQYINTKYLGLIFEQNGSIIQSFENIYLDRSQYLFSNQYINNNIWIIGKQPSYQYHVSETHCVWFSVIDQYGNEVIPMTIFDSIQNDNGSSLSTSRATPIGDNVLFLWERRWETLEDDDRQEILYQIRDYAGDIITATSNLSPDLLPDEVEQDDEYYVEWVLTDNQGKVWITYSHYYSSKSSEWFYVILNSDGTIYQSATQTSSYRSFYYCDKDGYIWVNESGQFFVLNDDNTYAIEPRAGVFIPNQNVGNIAAEVSSNGYRLYDRWSPQQIVIDVPYNVDPDSMKIYDLDKWQMELHPANIKLINGDTLLWSESGQFISDTTINISENLNKGINVLTMTQDDILGGQVLITFPFEVNYPPVIQNPIEDKIFEEDYGDTIIVNNINSVFSDENGDTLIFSVSVTGSSISATLVDTTIHVSTLQDMYGSNELIISASDGTHSVSDTFNITIYSVNDAPVINDHAFSIKENSPNGTIVDTVLASDVDVNDILSYTITNGNTNNAFAINTFNGEIIVNDSTQLDYETDSTFVLTVQVQDNGTGYLTADAAITINLINEVETSLEEVKSNGFIKIYPIPAKDLLVIKIDGDHQNFSQVIIYDLHGRILIKQKINGLNNQNEYDININSLSSGFYYISLDFGKTRIVRNFTVIR